MNCARGCTNPHTGQPAPATTGHLCTTCATAIRSALRHIPNLAVTAAERNDGHLTPGRETTDNTRHPVNPEPPTTSPGWDLSDEVRQWALRMAETHADKARNQGPFRYRRDGVPDVTNITQIVDYLLDTLTWHATVIPVETYDEVTEWRRRLEKMTGRDELIHRIKTPCSRCNQRTLIRRDGSHYVECRNQTCQARWHEDDFEWFAHVTAAG